MQRFLPIAMLCTSLLLAGCGSNQTAPNPSTGGDNVDGSSPNGAKPVGDIDSLVKDYGSFTKFSIWSEGRSETEIKKTLEKYGIGYTNLDSSDKIQAQGIQDCPERHYEFENQWVRVGTSRYYIDGLGRPLMATRELPFVGPGTRSEWCQSRVGQVYSGNSSGYYDGGHLIGNQLGGWGYRINLAPQERNFNRGNWLQIENAARACNVLPPEDEARFWYQVDLEYPNDYTNVPSEWDVLVTYENRPNWWEPWTPSYEQEEADFTNEYKGGWFGDDERRKITNFFAVRGCIN